MNRYRVLLPVLIDGEYGQGDEFEKEMTDDEEASALQSGLLEIVPATYKVLTSRLDFGGDAAADPGETLTVPLTNPQQRHLIGGGFIEPAEKPKTTRKKKED